MNRLDYRDPLITNRLDYHGHGKSSSLPNRSGQSNTLIFVNQDPVQQYANFCLIHPHFPV